MEMRSDGRARRLGQVLRSPSLAAVVFALALAPRGPAAAAEDPAQESALHIARLHYDGGGDWYSGKETIPNWLRGFQERTGIPTARDEVIVRPSDDALFRFPFAYMNGHGNVRFTDDEVDRLRRWMRAGGLLWANDDYGMDPSFRREVMRIFPDRELVELPNDHPIYSAFYTLPGLPKIHEHDNKPPQCFAIVDEGRVVVLYTYESDIGDGLEDPEAHKDPPQKREAAMRMAVNILMYALTH
jgi:hypothetical protein